MAAKRSRDVEASAQPQIPPPQSANQSFPQKDASEEALPTLTNWGGGHAEGGSVVSNARLTNQQRSTIQRAVCAYFLQNKCRKGADCQYSHDVDMPKQKEMCVFHFAGKCKNGHNCIYSHDGKLQPCKFLFGRGKCEHGSSCRFSHSPLSPEALAMVKEQWKNGGIKVAKETIESCALMAFDSFMSLNRHDLSFNCGIWGVSAWEQFEDDPSRLVPKIYAPSGGATTSDLKGMREFPQASPAFTPSDSFAPGVKTVLSDAPTPAAAQALSAHGQDQSCKDPAPQQPLPAEQAAEQGDGSEFWS